MTDTLTPQDLIAVLNVASKAPTTLGDGFALSAVMSKLVALANQPHPIGAIAPEGPAPAVSGDSEFPLPAPPVEGEYIPGVRRY